MSAEIPPFCYGEAVMFTLAAFWLTRAALTKKQRDSIIERDEGRSQMRHYSEDRGWFNGGYCEDGGADCTHLEIHHILPQRVAKKRGIDPDTPDNLITLYKCEHSGKCPDNKIKKGWFKR